jgi:hypothetical protein
VSSINKLEARKIDAHQKLSTQIQTPTLTLNSDIRIDNAQLAVFSMHAKNSVDEIQRFTLTLNSSIWADNAQFGTFFAQMITSSKYAEKSKSCVQNVDYRFTRCQTFTKLAISLH